MKADRCFKRGDLEAVTEAARRAEARTSAEIVPYLVLQADSYESPLWKSATMGALLAAFIAGVVHVRAEYWGGHPIVWTTLPAALGAALGLAVAWLTPALRRMLIDRTTMKDRVQRRAQAAFLEEQVFATKDRTGVLIFVALFERRVVVMGDQGINAKVRQEEWDGIASALAHGIGLGRTASALCDAIAACGELLERHGLAHERDDANELPDAPRIHDR